MAIATDLVCGESVETTNANWTVEHEGSTYYFCCKGCMLDFRDDPASFIAPTRQASTGGRPGGCCGAHAH